MNSLSVDNEKQDKIPDFAFENGLVIGKFYPFHKGHEFVIRTALEKCKYVYIIICWKENELPSLELRHLWIQNAFSNTKILHIHDQFDPDDSEVWAKETVKVLGFAPDVVFTSESYGEPYSKILGCKHFEVDIQRKHFPVSGTNIRSKPLRFWEFMYRPQQIFYTKRFVFVGPESTGKTTLCQEIANKYSTVWVPEYGRTFMDEKMRKQKKSISDYDQSCQSSIVTWDPEDFVHIANEQNKEENRIAQMANRILICDTDALATAVWFLRYMGDENQGNNQIYLAAILKSFRQQFHKDASFFKRHYFLTNPSQSPHVQDGTRDSKHKRQWMFETLLRMLTEQNAEFTILEGTLQEIQQQAIQIIESFFETVS